MSDHAAPLPSADLLELSEAIRALLARADRLSLAYVAIHLCNALASLESQAPPDHLPIGPGGHGGLPG